MRRAVPNGSNEDLFLEARNVFFSLDDRSKLAQELQTLFRNKPSLIKEISGERRRVVGGGVPRLDGIPEHPECCVCSFADEPLKILCLLQDFPVIF